MRLTDLAIRKLPFTAKGQKTYFDDQLGGFGVRVGRRTKSFVVMYGQARKLKTLGKYPDISLQDARNGAKKLLATRPAPHVEIDYKTAYEAFLDECRGKNRPKTVSGYQRYLKSVSYTGKIADLGRNDLRTVLSDPHKLATFKIFLNWCVRCDYLTRNPLIGDKVSYNASRERVLNDDELKAIWAYHSPPFSDIVKLLLLIGQRRTETSLITADWIDGDLITFPSSVTKNKKEHTIPFGLLASQYLPPKPFNSWSKAKALMDKTVKIAPWTLHDLRRTYATIHAQIGTSITVTEKLLNHSSGSLAGVASIYNRHTYLPEMRLAVQNYENHLKSLLSVEKVNP